MRKKEENLNTASELRIAMILLGITVTPVLLSSSSLGNQLSSSSLISIILSGGVILTLPSAVTISVGEKARLPTYGIVRYPFDEKGAIATNILMAISLFGWIAITTNMLGHLVHDLSVQHGLEVLLALLVAVGCVTFVVSTALGFTVLGKITQVAMLVIALVLCYIPYVAIHTEVVVSVVTVEMDIGIAVSTAVGTTIVLVTTLPDLGNFVYNRKYTLIAADVTSLVAYSLLYWAGVTPNAISDQGSLLGAVAVSGAVLPTALLLVFAYVTGDVGNMPQGMLVVSILFTRFPKRQIAVALGISSVIASSMDIMTRLIPSLLFLGVAMPPTTGVYTVDFFLYRHSGYQESVSAQESQIKVLTSVAWIIGAAVGLMIIKGLFTLTTISSVGLILVVYIAYVILNRASQHR